MVVLLTMHYQGDQIKEDEMEKARSMHAHMFVDLWLVNVKEKNCLKTKAQMDDNIRRNLKEISWYGWDWIRQAQNTEN